MPPEQERPSEERQIPPALPSATVMLIRDGAAGIEVFMVKRNYEIDFVSGALIFPGGKVEPGDSGDAVSAMSDGGADWPAHLRTFGATAIREAFEESGILLAREASGGFVSAERLEQLAPYRSALDKRELALGEMLTREGLRLALDQLVWFAHWITPERVVKRFDTHFFLARAPEGQIGAHDGRESIESVWIKPQTAIDDPQWNVIFPTKLNLLKLGAHEHVDAAIAAAAKAPPVTVTPWIEKTPEGKFLRIPDEAGYPIVREMLEGQTAKGFK